MDNELVKYLIDQSKRGRKKSFIELSGYFSRNVFTLCLRIIVDKNIAGELTKDIFLTAWENIRYVRDDTPIVKWLNGIAVYTIFDEIRTGAVRDRIYADNEPDENAIPVSSNDLENLIFNLEQIERIIFVLHDLENYTYEEITGFIDGFAVQETKKILKEARLKLMRGLNVA
ncbi:MAG: RNA polymerase sigma factor [Melioribacteraceae bacterium]|nr:RNA polymerase sigma factor [Melioribacteraceae bacterium]MCF8353228.1 RNA polymerase sigma factor [Melioribacteraceae bacterium]MCF8393960.1 RNA polymerase sigma factor [Melioribacteraceae bacterium]MCF8418738.1 RNA polymerase sigma factor [Melioribacteraceae bacterium]